MEEKERRESKRVKAKIERESASSDSVFLFPGWSRGVDWVSNGRED